MRGTGVEFRESPERLLLSHSLRPRGWGLFFGVGWLAIWFGAIAALAIRIQLMCVEGKDVPGKAWLFLAAMPPVGIFVLGHFIALWRGSREVQFSADGITVREKRWRCRERFYPRSRVTRLRGTYPGWTESLLFDFDDKPVGVELPLVDSDREKLLRHPQVRPFVVQGAKSDR